MNSRRTVAITRWILSWCALGGIVLVFRVWLHVNPTTVALALLLLILVLAAEWGLRYALVISVAAAGCYNFFFLPPVGTFTIADPQNWLALLAFLTTSIIASRLSQRARNEANDARAHQRELEILFRISRELLQSDSVATLLTLVPTAVAGATDATSVMLYLLDGERLYQAGNERISDVELPHLRKLTLSLSDTKTDGDDMQVPLRTGVRPTGLLVLRHVMISIETAEALGGIVSISIDRAQALERVARGEAAKESERLRTLMMDSITHELRTPLTSIKGAATALLAEKLSEESSLDLLSIINEESDRLNRLVSEAAEMAQLDTQQVQMHFEPTSVSDLIQSARETCSWTEEQHPMTVHVPNGLQVRGDRIFLEKVICNLLENAAKYSNVGSPITVSAEAVNGNAAISVADRGAGIDSAEQSLIFERFYRGRSQTNGASGTGMGLAISRAIVLAHGGDINVTSQLGQGSVFTVTLPRSE
jgi:two-component system sensor histidine kinase KdpD